MSHDVRIYQLQSNTGKSYLNVGHDTEYSLEVWGSSYDNPVYLALKDHFFNLLVFDDQQSASEWLDINNDKFDSIVEIR